MLLWLIQIVVVGAPAIGLAWLLRRAEVPGRAAGAAAVGGLVVGLLLGPSVFGRLHPEWHMGLFVGGQAEARALESVQRLQAAELAALRALEITPIAIEEARERHADERRPDEQALEAARAEFRRDFNMAGLIVAVGAATLGGLAAGRGIRHAMIRGGRGGGRSILAAVVFIALAGGLPALIWAAILQRGWAESCLIGLLTAAPGVWGLAPARLGWSLILALVSIVAALLTVTLGWAFASLALASATGAMAGSFMMPRSGLSRTEDFVLNSFAPTLIALAAVRADVHAITNDARFWPLLLLAVLWSADGRWAAAWCAARGVLRLPRPWSAAARALPPGTGLLIVSLALAAAHAGAADDLVLVWSCACAVMIECTCGARMWLADKLDSPDG